MESGADTSSDTFSSPESSDESAGQLTFDLPEGFVKYSEVFEENHMVYYKYDSDTIGSGFNVSRLINNVGYKNITAEEFMESIRIEMVNSGYDITPKLINEEEYEIDGRNTLRFGFEYTLDDMLVRQDVLIIDNDAEIIMMASVAFIHEGLEDELITCFDSVRFE